MEVRMVGGIGRKGPSDGGDVAPRRSQRLRNKEPQVTTKIASKKRVERSEPTQVQHLGQRVRPLPEEKKGRTKKAKEQAEVVFTAGKEPAPKRGRKKAERTSAEPPLLDQWAGRAEHADTLSGRGQRVMQTISGVYQRTPTVPQPLQTAAIALGSFYAMYHGHIKPLALVGIAGIEIARTILNRK